MRAFRFILASILVCMVLIGPGAAAAQGAVQADDGPVYLMLQAAVFDPLQNVPAFPAPLGVVAYPQGTAGPYIVQFNGPIQDAWKDELTAAGARIVGYLPDYAFLVWMDALAQARTSSLEAVRWVGLYQPAYKISPDLEQGKPGLVRVSLFAGADLAAVQGRLNGLNTLTTEVSGEIFVLVLPDGNVNAVAAWPEVEWIEPFLIRETHNDIGTGIMGGPTAWAANLNGSGMTVTVADTGIDSGVDTATVGDMHADFDNRLTHIGSWPVQSYGSSGCWNVGGNDGAADLSSGHGTHVLGSVAGNGAASSGQIKGLANQAALTFQAVEQYVDFTPACEGSPYYYQDGYYLFGIPDDLNTLFLEAYNWGSRIHSNSWGSNAAGAYSVDSQNVDLFIWNHPDMAILFSAGNEGTDSNNDGFVNQDSMGSPATAKNAITSGASDNERASGGYAADTWAELWPGDYSANPTGGDFTSDTRQELAAFSSRGPTDDGRIKPDVVAPGTNILSTRSRSITGYGWGSYYNNNYMYMGGTSMSNPLIAGAAALVREYYVEKRAHAAPSAALIKATLINTAVDITGYGNTAQEAGQPIPNQHEGWGLVNVGAAVTGQRWFVDGVTVTTAQTRTYPIQVSSPAAPLKISLVWSDYPGTPAAATELVNNLNLRVTAPNGTTVYLGNQFSGGWSVTGGSADIKNNVENVYVNNPTVGTWTVEVTGASVPNGPQPFALVGPEAPLPAAYKVYTPLLQKGGTPPVPAHLTLTKVVVNNNGGTALTTSFTLSASGPTPISGPGGVSSDVNAGTYTLSESGPAGYTASAWVCTGGVQVGNQVTLAAGQSASCTITNDDQATPALICNGDFEAATCWTEYSQHGWDIIVNSFAGTVTAHSGAYAAWLGGEFDDISYIQQQVTVPAATPYLAYWHWIASEDVCGWDFAEVRINSTVVVDYDLCQSASTGTWVHYVVNLNAYANQSVLLEIRVTADSSLNSNLFVDDVTFQSSATPLPSKAAGFDPASSLGKEGK